MNDSIFVIDPDNHLAELRRSEYGSEGVFQKLLADHPALLRAAAGPKGKLLLIRREQAVPDQLGGAERWSLDHLFVDGDAVPVLVEVKQASDTRARREVVAQMLDYAANGVAYWPIETISGAHHKTAATLGHDPDAELLSFLNGNETDAFWRQVDANLRSGRIRMVFVADNISKELVRIIEFLNEQMRRAEVLAIEVEHFLGASGVRTLVPRLVGATPRAQAAKSVEPEPMSVQEWLSDLEDRKGQSVLKGAERVIALFTDNGFLLKPTRSQDALAAQITRADGTPVWPFFIRKSSGRIETALGNLIHVPAYNDDATRMEILQCIRALPTDGVRATDNLIGWPSVTLGELLRDEVWSGFQSIVLTVKGRILQHPD